MLKALIFIGNAFNVSMISGIVVAKIFLHGHKCKRNSNSYLRRPRTRRNSRTRSLANGATTQKRTRTLPTTGNGLVFTLMGKMTRYLCLKALMTLTPSPLGAQNGAHIYFMFRIYLGLHLNLLLKQLKVLKRVRLSVGLCFRFQAYFVWLIRNMVALGGVLVNEQCVVSQGKILGVKWLNWDLLCWFRGRRLSGQDKSLRNRRGLGGCGFGVLTSLLPSPLIFLIFNLLSLFYSFFTLSLPSHVWVYTCVCTRVHMCCE